MLQEIQPRHLGKYSTAFGSVALPRRKLLHLAGGGLAALGGSLLSSACNSEKTAETQLTPNLAKEKLLQEMHDLQEKAKTDIEKTTGLKLNSPPTTIVVYADGKTFYINFGENSFGVTVIDADKEKQAKQDAIRWFNAKGITEPEKELNISWRTLPKFEITAVPNSR